MNAAAAKPGPSSSATFGLLYPGLKMIGGPLIGLGGQPIIFAYPGGGSGGGGGGSGVALGDTPTWTGAHTFSADVTLDGGTGALGFAAGETIVPADGALNVTGDIILPAADYIGLSTLGTYISFGAGTMTFGANTANAFDMNVTGGFGVLTPRPASGGKLLNNWMVDGGSDVVQLTVQGHSTQTTLPFVVENSAGTDVFTVSNAGEVDAAGDILITAGDFIGVSSTTARVKFGGIASAVEVIGNWSNGASAIGVISGSGPTYSTDGAKLHSFQNNTVEKAFIDLNGAFVTTAAEQTGTITLSGGTGTATVRSGAVCVCSNTSAETAPQCSVTTTTLTANLGAGTDTIAYWCN